MTLPRRAVLRFGSAGAVASLAGCSVSGGSQEYAPVVVENDHSEPHTVSMAVTTPTPDEGGGFTEYFSDAWTLPAGGSETFEKGLAFTDYQPTLQAMAMLEDETTATTRFRFDWNFEKLLVRVTEDGAVEITTPVRE